MKSIMLGLAAFLAFQFSTIAQEKMECEADVSALQEQIVQLANLLGDQGIIEEVTSVQNEEEITLTEESRISISDKDPNPYAIEQELSFSVPSTAKNVEVIFMNNLGQEIKSVDISERGDTSLKVYMSEYMVGNYNYSLVVDGVPSDS